MSRMTLVSQDSAKSLLSRFLSLNMGQGKRWTVEDVADATGISESSLEKYRAGTSVPTLEAYLSLASALGQSFVNATFRDLPLEVRSTEAGDTTPQQTLAQAAGFCAELAHMLADGRLDHREAAQLTQTIAQMQETLSAMQQQLKESGA